MVTTRDTGEVKHLYQMIKAVRTLQAIDPRMQLQTVMCFLMVANFGPCHMSNIQETANLSQASVSRNCSALGLYQRGGQKGFGLVETWEDPMNRKSKLVKLTPKGEALKDALYEALSKEIV